MSNNNNFSNNDPGNTQGNLRDFQGNASPLTNPEQPVNPNLTSDPLQQTQTTDTPVQDSQTQPQTAYEASRNFSSAPDPSTSQFASPQSPVVENTDPAQTPVNNMPPEPIPYNKPFNFMKFAFIFLVLVVLVVGGYLGYKYFLSSKKSSANSPSPTAAVTSEPTQAAQDQSNTSTSPATTIPNNDNPNQETIDFSKCNPGDGYSRSVPMGSTYLSVIDVDVANGVCHTEILNEVEGGFVKYSCNVPKTIGSVTFSVGDTGSDFSPITTYCTELKSGGSNTNQ